MIEYVCGKWDRYIRTGRERILGEPFAPCVGHLAAIAHHFVEDIAVWATE
jgi:hypothetical protein